MIRKASLLAATLLTTACAHQMSSQSVYDARVAEMMAGRGEFKSYSPLEAVPGATPTPLPRGAATGVDAQALATAKAYTAANNSSAYIVWHDGRVIDEAYYGDRKPTDTVVSKSLAKPITALAVGRAIMLGKIKSLDQPVADFIPAWRGKPQAAMTVRHLLDMRSGLLPQGFDMNPENHWNRAYLDPDHGRYIVERYPLTDTPGTKYEYSNATSELVAMVIEAATGRRYAEFVGNEVLKPIGATGGEVWINRSRGLAHSGCCIMLPPEDWVRMGILIMDDGAWQGRQLLPAGYVGEMRTGTAQNPHYGMGLWLAGPYVERRGFAAPSSPAPKVLHSAPYRARDLVLFDGNSNQVVYIVPSARLVVLRTGDNPPKTPEWDNTVLPNTLLAGMDYKGEAQPR